MARGKRRGGTPSRTAEATAGRPVVVSIEELPAAAQARLRQGELLSQAPTRVLWRRLARDQQRAVLAPEQRIGKRYPLTSGELAELTELPVSRVRYWADQKLLPCWRKGQRRLFEVPGAIAAFALTGSTQNDVQFYGDIMNEPAEELAAKLDIVGSLLRARLEDAHPKQAEKIAASLESFPTR